MRLTIAVLAVLSMSVAPVWAVGLDDDTPPVPSETTITCEEGQVWDSEAELCVPVAEVSEDNAALRPIIRELAYAERYADAAALLERFPYDDGFALTYRGFVARQTGDFEAAEGFYLDALAVDPGNVLARAYYGMGLASDGQRAAAEEQLAVIVAAAGADAWPARALRDTLSGASSIRY